MSDSVWVSEGMTGWSLDDAGRAALREAAVDLYRAHIWVEPVMQDAEALRDQLPADSASLYQALHMVHARLFAEGMRPILGYLDTSVRSSEAIPQPEGARKERAGTADCLAEAQGFIDNAKGNLADLVREAPEGHQLVEAARSVSELAQDLARVLEQHPTAFDVLDRAVAELEPAPEAESLPAQAAPPVASRWPWQRRWRGGDPRPPRSGRRT